MTKKIISLLVLSSFLGGVALSAEPASSKKRPSKKTQKQTTAATTPATPLPEGWSLVNGVWTHSDGYKFVQGRLIRTGAPSAKRPPNPPTQAQIDAVTKKKKAPATAAEISAAKAAERERNLRPAPAPRMGSNL